jgi:LPS export ABC transporter permease LptG
VNGSAAESADGRPKTRRGRLGRRLTRYVVRELAFPSLFAVAGFTLLAVAADLVAYSDLVINRDFGLREVAQIALFRTTPMLGRVIPVAVLIGSLVALGRLGADREILALEANGVSARRLAGPVTGFAVLLGVAALAITTVAGPWANRNLDAALAATAVRSEGTMLRSGVVNDIGPWRIQAQEVSSRGDHLRGVAIFVPWMGETIFAENVAITQEPGGDKLLRIEDGVVLRREAAGPAYVRFARMQQRIRAEEATAPPRITDWLAAASLRDLKKAMRTHSDSPEGRAAQAEWQRRFALPAAAGVFGLLAVPLFLRRGHRSRSGGAAVGLVAVGVYFGLLQLSNSLLNADGFPVPLAVWFPNLALGALSLVLLARIRRPWASDRETGRRAFWRREAAASGAPPRDRRFVLDRYVMLRFAETTALCFAVMLLAFVLIDVIDNLQWFTRYHSTLDEVARFYAARLPLLTARVVPMALLVGAALTVSLLGVSGELLAMRACGIPPLRPVLPILALCVITSLCYMTIIDQIVPHAAARATRIKRFEIKNQAERHALWQRVGDRLYEVDRIDPLRGVAQGLTIFEIGADGFPRSRTDAPEARHVGKGVWELRDPERVETGPDGPRPVGADAFVRLGQDLAAEVNSSGLSIRELRSEIRHVERQGYDATPYRVDLQVRLASPLACVVLPTLALLFAMGGPPFPRPARILLISAAVGAGHILLSALGTSLGYGGALPPGVAGWGPAVVSIGIATAVARRTRVLGF